VRALWALRYVQILFYFLIFIPPWQLGESHVDVLYNPGSLCLFLFSSPTRQASEIVLFWLLSPLVLVTVFHIRCRRPLVSNGIVHFTPFKVSEILFRPVASRSMEAIPRFVRLERISLSFCSVALDEYYSLFTLVPR